MYVYDYKFIFGERDLSLIYLNVCVYTVFCNCFTPTGVHACVLTHGVSTLIPQKRTFLLITKHVAALNSALISSHLCCTMGKLPVASPRAVSQCFMGSLGGKQALKLEGEYK